MYETPTPSHTRRTQSLSRTLAIANSTDARPAWGDLRRSWPPNCNAGPLVDSSDPARPHHLNVLSHRMAHCKSILVKPTFPHPLQAMRSYISTRADWLTLHRAGFDCTASCNHQSSHARTGPHPEPRPHEKSKHHPRTARRARYGRFLAQVRRLSTW